jgi:hypothetical protein
MSDPDFAKSVQVRVRANAGVFLSMSTISDRLVMAPLTCDEALKLADDLVRGVQAYRDAEAFALAEEGARIPT